MASTLTHLMAVALLFPLVAFPTVVVFTVLTGTISVGGLWRDSFDVQALSVSRVYQSLAAFAVVGTTLIGLAASGATSFPPIPGWLLGLAGGGNAVYLGAKWMSSRRRSK